MNQQAMPLHAAVEMIYRTFAHYQAPIKPLDLCLLDGTETELSCEMRTLPLHQLSQRHFNEYSYYSYQGKTQSADDIKYYLPRMLDLLAQGAECQHNIDTYLERLGNCDAYAFTPQEKVALRRYARSFFSHGLAQWGTRQCSLFQGEYAFTILRMWDCAGIPIQPLLDDWLSNPSEAATLSFVDAYYWEYWKNNYKITLANHKEPFRKTMHAWLRDQNTKAAWANKLLKLVERTSDGEWRLTCAIDHENRSWLTDRVTTVLYVVTNE